MAIDARWLVPDLSLTDQLKMEIDRKRAANLSREQLAQLADSLIQDWWNHRSVIDRALGRVRHLEVELAMAGAPQPSKQEILSTHLRMARELMNQKTNSSNI
jgi:hypothetical protein